MTTTNSNIVIYKATATISISGNVIIDISKGSSYIDSALKNYIDQFNGTILERKIQEDIKFDFLFVYHSLSDLITKKHYIFAQDFLIDKKEDIKPRQEETGLYYYNPMNLEISKNTWLPMIHITLVDVLKEYHDCSNTNFKAIAGMSNRFKSIIDSSIWNYYVPIEVQDNSYNFERLKYAIQQITQNFCSNGCCDNSNLYNLSITHEYADLNARLVRESYLIKDKDSHGAFISPFKFHSEKEIEDELKKKKDKNDFFFHTKWRILLLDDHANKCLSGDNDSVTWDETQQQKTLCNTGKLRIILNDLQSIGSYNIVWCCPTNNEIEDITKFNKKERSDLIPLCWHSIGEQNENNSSIAIVCARTIGDAKTLMNYMKFDFILLDYLLGTRKDQKIHGREYSYELLRDIASDYEDIKRNEKLTKQERLEKMAFIGPMGRLYFMHISAFVPAISERLQEQGLIRDTQYWHIARGACPTNTPKLFLYYLYRLMEKRYSEMMFYEEDKIEGNTLIDLLRLIFTPPFSKVKENATKYFRFFSV